ncbi:urease accessory protein UreE [Ancylobacter sp. Lp-2]|uniref:urease accessory protein UreE n=1 Tax=Ancylobacter sp. Lp-2 TaxID=2881339 RepID=UPI001E613509|nr:urease accessory protein UreE [Ancylobacter sp. Lp-2]MCB4767736.1 urease accessory protein UreE [Ancylobacter sp. Lp-2]
MSAPAPVPTEDAVLVAAIVGSRLDHDLGHRLHHMEEDGEVETVRLETRDMTRRRLRVTTDRGTTCLIALPRSEQLFDGAILLLEPHRAIVLRAQEQAWLRLRPASLPDALQLGYAAGNLHWKVRFAGEEVEIALEGPRQAYLDRIRDLIAEGRVMVPAAEAGH